MIVKIHLYHVGHTILTEITKYDIEALYCQRSLGRSHCDTEFFSHTFCSVLSYSLFSRSLVLKKYFRLVKRLTEFSVSFCLYRILCHCANEDRLQLWDFFYITTETTTSLMIFYGTLRTTKQ